MAFHAFCNETEENLERHLTYFTSKELKGRKAGSEGADKAARYIYSHFLEIGLNPQYDSFKNGKYKNVIGTIPSNNGKYIIIGAHYDGVGYSGKKIMPAADDNASGVSTMIEIARILAKEKLEYGIKFIAYDGEEQGLLGSIYDASKIDKNDNNYVLMLSIDMVGHLRDEGRLIYSGSDTFIDGEELIRRSNINNIGIRIKPVWPYAGLSTDTLPYDAKAIPTLNIDTGEETSALHTTGDTFESIDIHGMMLITEQICSFIKTVQGQIIPTGFSLYKETEARYGICLPKMFNISLFAMFPMISNRFGDFYGKIQTTFGDGYVVREDEIIGTYNFAFYTSITLSQKVGTTELLMGLGPYYETYFEDFNTLANQEIGVFYNMELKSFSGVNRLFDSISFGYICHLGIKDFYDSNVYKVNERSSVDAYLGFYF